MGLTSPRRVAPYHTDEFGPRVTSPITLAEGAMKAAAVLTAGATPSTATMRVDGTSRSVCLATSIEAPMESRAWPALRAAEETALTTRAPRDISWAFSCLLRLLRSGA